MSSSNHFRIQYANDLHLELYDTPPSYETLLIPSAPYLALAGDIGHPKQLASLLAWAAPRWRRIFYVPGNHEYYWLGADDPAGKKTMSERQEALREVVGMFGNVHILETGVGMSHYLAAENVAIVGCTMWTLTGPGAYRHCNDYRRIPNITPASLNAVHLAEVAALRSEIAAWTARGADICVITHHMPSFRLIHPTYAGLDGNDCFAARMDDLFVGGAVRVWIYGHTHVSGETMLGQTRCCVNSRGYADEKRVGAPYRRDAVVSIQKEVEDEVTAAEAATEDLEFL
jgi:Calcineurin-like phosphoesterase